MTERSPNAAAGPERIYFEALAAGRFQIQHCRACACNVFYPRVVCPHCGHGELEWMAASGRGTVYSTSVVHRKSDQGGNYNVALVDLVEGVRMMSRVEDLTPEKVRIGMRVMARIVTEQGQPLVVFVPDEVAS